jgi:uncharacterized protein
MLRRSCAKVMEPQVIPWRPALMRYIESEARPVEKFGHQVRLYALTQEIGRGQIYDDEIVCAATWLHDLGVFTGHRPEELDKLEAWDSVLYAMLRVPELLTGFGFPSEKIAAVVECIRTHQPHFEPETLEATILRDADILEQLGAIGAMRTICKVGRDTRFHTFTDAIRSLRRALETLPGLLRLDASKVLAAPRIETLRMFVDAVDAEAQVLL